MSEPAILLMRLPLPKRSERALWMRQPCADAGCLEGIGIAREAPDRLRVQHGENPEHVTWIADATDTTDIDAAVLEIQTWLWRVHPPSWASDA